MTREQFLQELRIALQGRIPQAQVNENLTYYENYIMEESRKGRTEEEVIEALGSPRLIAKTIIESLKRSGREEKGRGARETRSFRFGLQNLPVWTRRLLAVFAGVVFIILLLQTGALLLPVFAAVFMTGSILSVMFRIFFRK